MPDLSFHTFDDLLRAARQQHEPQRLLFVFVGAELPEDSTPEERRRFAAGDGGALVPLMCVAKTPDEVDAFASLVEESRRVGPSWAVVFVASLGGHGGRAPTSGEAERPLQSVVESIKAGAHHAFIPFDPDGRPIHFE